MCKRQAILILMLFIVVSYLGFSVIEQNHDRETEILLERIKLLEQMIITYEVKEVLSQELEIAELNVTELESYDQRWIQWIQANQWIVEVDWGE